MRKWSGFKTNHEIWQIAYLAGIIDGEGCIYIGYGKHGKYGSGYQWLSVMQVTNCEENLIIWLENTFGGVKAKHSRWTSKKAFYRPIYQWNVTGKMLDYLLPLIHPYLVIKKKHCEIMMQYRLTSKNLGSKRLPQEVHEKRFELLKQIRQLNSRYHNHPLKDPSALLP
jgi:hypothetical protein